MVPGIGGNVLCYGELARLLGTDQPFYGLQARGLDEREHPFERIEPMATHYVAEIRRVQPRGPYRIGGTCFGGLVAYEMARQLRQAGETTEMLFLLEAWPPPKPRPVVDALRTRSHQLRFFASAVRRNIAALRQQTLGHVVRALLAALGTVGEIARKGIYRGDTATMVVDRVTIANERSLLHYRLQPHAVHCARRSQRAACSPAPTHARSGACWRRTISAKSICRPPTRARCCCHPSSNRSRSG